MSTVMKTPGVYIVEKNAFPNSVVEVATAVPAFIGYTAQADNKGQPLKGKPWRITSMADYQTYFGGPPVASFAIAPKSPGKAAAAAEALTIAAAKATAAALNQPPAAQEAAAALTSTAKQIVDALTTDARKAAITATAAAAKAESDAQALTGKATTDPEKAAAKAATDAAAELTKTASGLTTAAEEAEAGPLLLAVKAAEKLTAQAVEETTSSQKMLTAAADDPAKAAAKTATDQALQATEQAKVATDTANKNLQAANATPSATPPVPAFTVNGLEFSVTQAKSSSFLLYYSMLLFFQNGGGPCYITSVGTYDDTIDKDKLTAGIDLLLKEQEPTMVVIPDAVLLSEAECISTQQAALKHCGLDMKSRIAILDIWGGYRERSDNTGNCIDNFRNDLGINQLDYGAAYYPWLHTTVVGDSDLGFENISNLDVLRAALKLEAASNTRAAAINTVIDAVQAPPPDKFTVELLNKILVVACPAFVSIRAAMKSYLNVLPPSGAIAGIYTAVDNTRGVWKAPANVSINSVVSPTVSISSDDQEDLNVTTQGKSVNAIRSFIGEGTLVWGARTLDGNSLDWRYISVRRTMIMLEQSVKLATKAYVFENNVSTTWVTVKSMIRNFLTSVWKRGGLAGASPDDAFAVFCGLGETMTPEDILEGILRVTVLVAVTRPAEFIEITFQQQMQKS